LIQTDLVFAWTVTIVRPLEDYLFCWCASGAAQGATRATAMKLQNFVIAVPAPSQRLPLQGRR
jgi:hypothetical protein